MADIKKSTLTFLKQLARNNNRDWFNENRPKYEAALENMIDFAEALLGRLSETDLLVERTGKKVLNRIYRDTRFSKDKTPYKRHFGGGFTRDGKSRRGGYYFQVLPQSNVAGTDDWMTGSLAAGGFYAPERDDLKRLREEFAVDVSEYRAITSDPEFVRLFGEMRGDKLKTAPRGIEKDHPNIDVLRHKNFYVFRTFHRRRGTKRCVPGFKRRSLPGGAAVF